MEQPTSTNHDTTPNPDAVARGRGNRRFALGTAGGVVVGIVAITGALSAIPPRGTAVATPAPAASGATSSATKTTPSLPPVTTATATPTSATPSASPSGTPVATPTATPSTAGGGVLLSLDKGSYVAVFEWLTKSKYTAAQAADFAANNQKAGFDVVAFDGDLVQKNGSWGVGVVGLDNFSTATAACKAMGFATNGSNCYRRIVG